VNDPQTGVENLCVASCFCC